MANEKFPPNIFPNQHLSEYHFIEDQLPAELQIDPNEKPKSISKNWLTGKLNDNSTLVTLLASFVVILVSLSYWVNFLNLADLMPATHLSIFQNHQYWRLWTTLLVHADQKHLLGNLFLFYIFGIFLSGYFGVLVFPLMAFLMGGLTNYFVLAQMPESSTLIGLSGVVFWMGGVWLTLYFLIETRKSLLQRSIRTLGVALVLFMPSEAFDPNISYHSHLLGFLLGVGFAFLFYFKNRSQFLSADTSAQVY